MAERAEDGAEPPATIAAALAAADVFLAPTAALALAHARAQGAPATPASGAPRFPGATADLLARVMDVDMDRLRRRSRALAQLLTEADEAHVTCARGSDLRLDLRGRDGLSDDGDLTAPGAFGNLPCGEGFIAPAGGEGRAVVSSARLAGHPRRTVELTVETARSPAPRATSSGDALLRAPARPRPRHQPRRAGHRHQRRPPR